MQLLKVKTARFADVVKECGAPRVITLWQDPKNDKSFQQAVRDQRVMSVHQTTVGARKDFAEVVFLQGPNLSYLIFPKPLKRFAGQRIVGINYDLLAKEESGRERLREEAGEPKKRAVKSRAAKSSANIERRGGGPEDAGQRARKDSGRKTRVPLSVVQASPGSPLRQKSVAPPPADRFMLAAINEARTGLDEGGIPIGSALVRGDRLLAVGHNKRVQEDDPVTHAETDCLRNAGRIGSFRGCTLYSTLMPCYFCAGAAVQFGITRVVVGESRNFAGAPEFMREHGIEVVNLDLPECYEMMAKWIRQHPKLWNEDIGKP